MGGEKIINKIEEEIRLGKYWDENYRTVDLQLLKDTLATLKKQKPRVITRDELKQFEGFPCWFESSGTYMGKDGFWILPAMFRTFFAGVVMPYTSVLNGVIDCGELDLSVYNKAWRCWTTRPTTGQRKAVKWE